MKCLIFAITIAFASVSQAQLVIREAWNKSIKGTDAIYGCDSGVYKAELMSVLMRESPLPTALVPRAMDLAVEFSAENAKTIGALCKKQSQDISRQISCVSHAVKMHFENMNFTGLNSFCRSHAYAFNKAFAELDIPRSTSATFSLEGKFSDSCQKGAHVVNRVVIVSERGQPYSYIIDSGWFPGEAFPLSQNTVDYHSTHQSFPNLADKGDCVRGKLPQSGLLELLSKIRAD